jgi:hypothetical protein
MKKLLFACTMLVFGAMATQAQDKEAAKPALSKEKKAELKKLKEENLNASFTEVGLKDEQITLAKAAIEDANRKSKELREDNTLTEEAKKAKKDAINDEKNEKLKVILGEKYKQWQSIRKSQKAAEEEAAAKN